MEKIINVELLRSYLGKDGQEKISEFEKYLIQEGVKSILLGNNINEAMIKFLEDIKIINGETARFSLGKDFVETQKKIKQLLKEKNAFHTIWDYKGLSNNANFFGTQKDWNQTLIEKISETSAYIRKKSLQGGGNLIIMHSDLEFLVGGFQYFKPSYKEFNGYCKLGVLGSRYDVISASDIAASDEIIICRYENGKNIEDSIADELYGVIKVLNYANYLN